MRWEDRTCEKCSQWDDINGCWADQETDGAGDMACPLFDGEMYEDEDEDEDEDNQSEENHG